MSKRSCSSLVSNLIICWSVTLWASTPRGMQCPQPENTAGIFRPLEHGMDAIMQPYPQQGSSITAAAFHHFPPRPRGVCGHKEPFRAELPRTHKEELRCGKVIP